MGETNSLLPNNHEYVDLGLSSGTLWAICNVGANAPEEYGDYFAWGETEPQASNSYSWGSYKWCKGSSSTMIKYCTKSNYGTVDNKTELEFIDDAATANQGAEWKMPTYIQLAELINPIYNTITWTTQNGVYGQKITSNINGNSIFFPAAGYCLNGSLNKVDSFGRYWCSSLLTSNSTNAYSFDFTSSYYSRNSNNRYYGFSVRPVFNPNT